MNPTVLRADVPDVIAHAFYTIGYRPSESLVLVGRSTTTPSVRNPAHSSQPNESASRRRERSGIRP